MIRLTEREIDLVREVLYDRAGAPTTRLFHRTGENSAEPLFEEWIKLANLFRDAKRVEVK